MTLCVQNYILSSGDNTLLNSVDYSMVARFEWLLFTSQSCVETGSYAICYECARSCRLIWRLGSLWFQVNFLCTYRYYNYSHDYQCDV